MNEVSTLSTEVAPPVEATTIVVDKSDDQLPGVITDQQEITKELISTDEAEKHAPEVGNLALSGANGNAEVGSNTNIQYTPLSDEDVRAWVEYYVEVGVEVVSPQGHGNQQRVLALRRLNSLRPNPLQEQDLEALERIESAKEHPYKPTLGLEIEIYRYTLLTDEQRKLPKQDQDEILKAKFDQMEAVKKAGIPRDESDSNYWEFAFKPANDADTITAELGLLQDMGLIDMSKYYPIHITLGGVTSDESNEIVKRVLHEDRHGEETLLLLRAIEATGWATTSKRMRMPFEGKRGPSYWRSGTSGLLEREMGGMRFLGSEVSSGIEGNTDYAVELRTLCVKGESDFAQALEAIESLGTCLAAYQDVTRKRLIKSSIPTMRHRTIDTADRPQVREGVDVSEALKLAHVWSWFSQETSKLFERRGIKEPSTNWQEPYRKRTRSSMGDYDVLATLLESAENGQTEGVEFRENIRNLVEEVAENVKRIIQK